MDGITQRTTEDTFAQTAAEAPRGARVPVELRLSVPDPFEAYRRARDGEGGFYLETTGGQSGWGYFGIDPVRRLEVSQPASARDSQAQSPSIDAIDGLLGSETLVRGACSVPYPCGAFGWLSYDVAREVESIPDSTIDEGLPQLQLGVYDRVAAWREPRGEGSTELIVTACPVVTDSVSEAYRAGRDRARALARAAIEGSPTVSRPERPGSHTAFSSECGEPAFADRVSTIKRYIRDGDTFQTNVSHRLTAPATVHPVEAYDALRRVNPAPYSGLLEFPGVDLVSASPELLLSVEGDRLATEPIAGTRPRGETEAEDQALERELTDNDKERAEHAMLVDLERNDLGKVCEYGSVSVPEYRRVDRYSEVMHLVSLVDGQLRTGTSIAEAVAGVFPGGTITGAPKPRTMQIIDEVERTRRGPYTGSMAAFGFDGAATLNIIIRTLVHRDREYRLRVGSGIVHDSNPAQEYQETLDKARALVTAVDEALEDRASFVLEADTGSLEGD